MPGKDPELTDHFPERQKMLSKWESEGEREAQRSLPYSTEQPHVPPLTDAELIHLRVRVIALENMVISLLAQISSPQLDLAREIAGYILPRPGITQHPLTIHAAHQMVDLIERAGHFRGMQRAI